jgi:hypothetical protein
MYRSLAANLGEMQTSVASEPLPIEIEIAELIKKAGHNLRGGLPSDSSDLPEAIKAAAGPQGWDFRMSSPERILEPSCNAKTNRATLLSGVLLGTLLIGAICAWVLNFDGGSSRLPQKDYSKSQIVKSDRDNYGVPNTLSKLTTGSISAHPATRYTAIPPSHRPDAAQSRSRRTAELQKNVGTSKSPSSASGRALNPGMRPLAFPETKPATIEGWTVRDVVDGTATLQGPGGIWRVSQRDEVPGLGSVNSIVRWGSRWIVATSGGLISTP